MQARFRYAEIESQQRRRGQKAVPLELELFLWYIVSKREMQRELEGLEIFGKRFEKIFAEF